MLASFLQGYFDDILIVSKTQEEHLIQEEHQVFRWCSRRGDGSRDAKAPQALAKASKCQFGTSSVEFLGHVISERCVAIDSSKVAPSWSGPRRHRAPTCAASKALPS